jgi:hypothetical protein
VRAFIVALLWLVVLWRLRSARAEPWRRALWLALAGLAAALTLDLPLVITAVDSATGVPDMSTLLKHLAGIIASAAVLDWVIALTRPQPRARRPLPRHVIAAATAIALTVLFFATRRTESTDFASTMAGDPTATAYLMVFETYLGIAMATAAGRFSTAGRAATGGLLLRYGLWTLTAGTALGAVYALLRLIVLAGAATGTGQMPSTRHAIGLTDTVQAAAILLILVGCTLPAVSVAWRNLCNYRDLRTLRPLWAGVTAAAPHVILGPPPRRRDDLRIGQDLRVALLRRTAEIRDAALLLRGYVTLADHAAARQALSGTGLTGAALDAATEAAWLHAAARAKKAGAPAADGQGGTYQFTGGTDLSGEVRWLTMIAAAWQQPAVLAVAGELASRPAEATR